MYWLLPRVASTCATCSLELVARPAPGPCPSNCRNGSTLTPELDVGGFATTIKLRRIWILRRPSEKRSGISPTRRQLVSCSTLTQLQVAEQLLLTSPALKTFLR